jgi:hypothetical protein
MVFISIALISCGGGGSAPPTIVTQILSDPAFDGDIQVPFAGSPIIIAQGNTQSVFAGIDPFTFAEYRAFLDFPLTGVPVNAVIVSAVLDIVIDNIILQSPGSTIPIRIDLVFFQPPTLIASDFDRNSLQPLATTTIIPPISSFDFGQHVFVDVTSLMMEAQRLGLPDFQIRILEDLGPVSPGLIEINDTTGPDRVFLAPLLQVEYF